MDGDTPSATVVLEEIGQECLGLVSLPRVGLA